MTPMLLLPLALALLPHALSYAPDTILPSSEPTCDCLPWSTNATAMSMFVDASAVKADGPNAKACALPSLGINPDPTNFPEYTIYDGYCLCDQATSESWYSWCLPPSDVPSQVNLLPVGSSGVVVNFVIADGGERATSADNAPVAELRLKGEEQLVGTFLGYSTLYSDSTADRKLSYFNVEMVGLKERTEYEYRVRSGEDGATFTSWTTFKSLYSSGETKFAMYADMGLFGSEDTGATIPSTARHNIGNVLDDVLNGDVDFIVHSGDHAYEFEVGGGARGDGYMDQYSDVLRRAPWLPGWGNHEYLEMDRGNRLANITGGLVEALGQDRMHYSVDIGLAHILQLDLSPYYCNFESCYGVDTCGFPDKWLDVDSETGDFAGYREELLEFVKADLKGVDRLKTPWVIVTSHFPFYDTTDAEASSSSLDEDLGASGRRLQGATTDDGVAPSRDQAVADIEHMLLSYSVDIYFCGHNHNYETTWPVFNGTAVQADFINPKAPVHILAGSAGPPETDQFTADSPAWSREPRLTDNSYSRVYMKNATHLFYEQVKNDDGSVLDSFVIVKE